MRRCLLAAALVATLAAVATASADAALKARGSIKQAYVLGAKKGQRLALLDAQGRVVATAGPTGSAARSSASCGPGGGYRVGRAASGSRPFRVLRAGRRTRRAPSTRRKKLKQGLNYVKMRDGVELAMTVRLPGRQDAQRRPVPDPHRVLGLPGRGAARPARLVSISSPGRAGRPARARDLDRRRLADRAAARLRRGQRADARLGLLGRRLRPVRPARPPTTATTRSRPSPRRTGSRAARSAWPASRSPGITQLFAAGTRPPHLAAIAPMSVTDDLYTGHRLPGRDLQLRLRARPGSQERMDDAQAGARGRPALGPGARQAGRQALPSPTRSCACRPRTRSRSRSRTRSARRRCSRSARRARGSSATKVPTFLVGQFQDEQTGGHFAESLKYLNGNPNVWISLQNGVHADSLGPSTITRWAEFLKLYVADEIPVIPQLGARRSAARSTGTSPTRGAAPVQQSRFAGMTERRRRQGRLRADPRVRAADGQRRRPAGPGLDRRDLGARLRRLAAEGGAADALLPRPERRRSARKPRDGGSAALHAPTRARGPRQTLPGDGAEDAWKAQPPYNWAPVAAGKGLGFATRAARPATS